MRIERPRFDTDIYILYGLSWNPRYEYHIHQSNLHHQLHWMDEYMARKVVDQTRVYTNARSEFILLNL